jgi:hypothetical protein
MTPSVLFLVKKKMSYYGDDGTDHPADQTYIASFGLLNSAQFVCD